MSEVKNLELFKVGTHRGKNWTKEDCQSMVDNFNAMSQKVTWGPKVTSAKDGALFGLGETNIGHDDLQRLKRGLPSLGKLANVRFENDTVLTDVDDMPDFMSDAIKNGMYKGRSVEIYGEKKTAEFGLTGPMIRGMAWLGYEPEELKMLSNDFDLYCEESEDDIHYINYSEKGDGQIEGSTQSNGNINQEGVISMAEPGMTGAAPPTTEAPPVAGETAAEGTVGDMTVEDLTMTMLAVMDKTLLQLGLIETSFLDEEGGAAGAAPVGGAETPAEFAEGGWTENEVKLATALNDANSRLVSQDKTIITMSEELKTIQTRLGDPLKNKMAYYEAQGKTFDKDAVLKFAEAHGSSAAASHLETIIAIAPEMPAGDTAVYNDAEGKQMTKDEALDIINEAVTKNDSSVGEEMTTFCEKNTQFTVEMLTEE